MSTPDPAPPHADVAGYVLGVLDPLEAQDFTLHLDACPACRQEVAELASLRIMLDQGMPTPVLPAGLAERTFAAIREEESSVPPPRPGRRRRAAVAAALAGVAAVAAGLAMLTIGGGTPTREIALVAAGGGGGEGTARLQRADTGVSVELAVRGLPVAPEGSYYECWYVGEADTVDRPSRVTAGTFKVRPGGTTTVAMTTAADHRRFPGIEVTLEPADGDPARTGPVVLRSAPGD